ncbi:MGDG synthase family glycosyltransferase [Paenibacillus humicola]|uniref:MGDG synthase family glycosyltransferase n=1 Tax=Paenibacillus humicola TaxID=3110540 RepID=UPI00237AD6A7|nr:glycosyltransferase [Paenibacillus humicola]
MLTSLTAACRPKLMILYASYGEGHLQAACALRDALESLGIGRTVLVDLLAEAHPWINGMTRRFYMKSFTLMPGLYGWLYDRTRPMKHDSLFAEWLHSFGRDRLRRLLSEERPDAVIHTFPLLAMPALKRRTGLHIPTCTVVTDFDLHRRWVHPDIDRYYVPTEDMRRELISLGIPDSRICVSGIPLKSGFRSVAPAPGLRKFYGLPESGPVVLLMAGARGVLPGLAGVIAALLKQPQLTVALVCGRNETLARQIRSLFAGRPEADRLRVFGFVERMHELMAVASCIVTKPGGVTLAEALAAELPIFAYKPVPGQERNNALYLAGQGAATIACTPDQLCEEILKLLGDPIRLKTSRHALRKLQHGSAADTVALDFCSSLHIMEGALGELGRR